MSSWICTSFGTISKVYTTFSVTGNLNATGGLVGFKQSGTLQRSYSAGEASGDNSVGGLIGTIRWINPKMGRLGPPLADNP